jgi:hypothetical protein
VNAAKLAKKVLFKKSNLKARQGKAHFVQGKGKIFLRATT